MGNIVNRIKRWTFRRRCAKGTCFAIRDRRFKAVEWAQVIAGHELHNHTDFYLKRVGLYFKHGRVDYEKQPGDVDPNGDGFFATRDNCCLAGSAGVVAWEITGSGHFAFLFWRVPRNFGRNSFAIGITNKFVKPDEKLYKEMAKRAETFFQRVEMPKGQKHAVVTGVFKTNVFKIWGGLGNGRRVLGKFHLALSDEFRLETLREPEPNRKSDIFLAAHKIFDPFLAPDEHGISYGIIAKDFHSGKMFYLEPALSEERKLDNGSYATTFPDILRFFRKGDSRYRLFRIGTLAQGYPEILKCSESNSFNRKLYNSYRRNSKYWTVQLLELLGFHSDGNHLIRNLHHCYDSEKQLRKLLPNWTVISLNDLF